jgi:hypothetical protein
MLVRRAIITEGEMAGLRWRFNWNRGCAFTVMRGRAPSSAECRVQPSASEYLFCIYLPIYLQLCSTFSQPMVHY